MTCCIIPPSKGRLLWDESYNNTEFKNVIKQQIARLINDFDVRHFIIGMEYNLDVFITELIIKIKEDIPLTLECILTESQLNSKQYSFIMNHVDIKTITNNYPEKKYVENYFLKSSQYAISLISRKPKRKYGDTYFSWSKNNVIIINAEDLSVYDYFYKDNGSIEIIRFFYANGFIGEYTVLREYSGKKTIEEFERFIIRHLATNYS